jgi:hypothetical protein
VLLDQQIREPGLEADDCQGQKQGHRQNNIEGSHKAQVPLVQTPLVQSAPTLQCLPVAQVAQTGPPQSTSVSPPFFTPSLHVGAWQTPPLQTWLAQALPGQQGCKSPPHGVHVPLPLQTKLPPQAVPAAANTTPQVLFVHVAVEH